MVQVIRTPGAAMPRLKAILEKAKKTEMKVGFVDGEVYPDTGETVAQVAYKNEFGDGRTPPRPFMRPAVGKNTEAWRDNVTSSVFQAIDGGIDMNTVFEALGITVVDDIRQAIRDVQDPPLAEMTLENRRAKRSAGIYVYDLSKPLMDSLRMFNNVSFIIEEKQ